MKIQYDGQDVIELTETQKKVIQNDIPLEIFESDMVRRCKHWVEHPCNKMIEENQERWEKALSDRGARSVPVDKEALAAAFEAEFPVPLKAEEDKESVVMVDDKEAFRVKPLYKKLHKMQGVQEPETHCMQQMAWILQHKYERCFERLKREWLPKLQARGVKFAPVDEAEFAELVFSQPDYKSRSQRDAEDPQ